MRNAESKSTTYKGIDGIFVVMHGQKWFMSNEFENNMRKHSFELTDEEWEENAPAEMIESDKVASGYGFMMNDTYENWEKVRRYKYDAIEMVD